MPFVFFSAVVFADLLDIEEDIDEPKKIIKLKQQPEKEKIQTPKKTKKFRDPASFSGSDSENCRVYFRGDELEASKQNRDIYLKRNVEVTRCRLKMNSQKAHIFLGEGSNEVEKVTANGSIKVTNDDLTTGEKVKATGSSAIYEKNKQTITLFGNPAVIIRGKSKIKGKKVIYQMLKGTIKVSNVKGTLYRQDSN